ncbi:MAG: hypothetical protein M0Z51_15255 [Propionibacterium sp.]|nr:hypothetical protein [Propionibacterium sp.]
MRKPTFAAYCSRASATPRRVRTSLASKPAEQVSDHSAAGTQEAAIRATRRGPDGRTPTGKRRTTVHPIVRYPGQLASLDVLNTMPSPAMVSSATPCSVNRRRIPRLR